jgi:hypothetical protein
MKILADPHPTIVVASAVSYPTWTNFFEDMGVGTGTGVMEAQQMM